MAAYLLESLVLRGCVRQDVLAVGLRLVSAEALGGPNPGNTHSSPNPATQTKTPQAYRPDGDTPSSGLMPGVGRSCRWFGSVLVSRLWFTQGEPSAPPVRPIVAAS